MYPVADIRHFRFLVFSLAVQSVLLLLEVRYSRPSWKSTSLFLFYYQKRSLLRWVTYFQCPNIFLVSFPWNLVWISSSKVIPVNFDLRNCLLWNFVSEWAINSLDIEYRLTPWDHFKMRLLRARTMSLVDNSMESGAFPFQISLSLWRTTGFLWW